MRHSVATAVLTACLGACAACGGTTTSPSTVTPSTPPITFSLSGQVTDSATGAAISGASVSIVDGPNAGKSATTDGSGNYGFTDLLQSGFTVNVSANNYVSQSKGVTLTSNQTLSFQLTPKVTVGFNGLTANAASVTTYTESGVTVSATSGPWVASTTFGNPAPFIQFYASPGTTVTGEVRVAAGGSVFSFYSVDLYSSITPIPYTIRGIRNGSSVFTLTDTLPNTFGAFRTVAKPPHSTTRQ